jgi:8-hydroxy-5-deazaflavin:NADPH oxidoreductase
VVLTVPFGAVGETLKTVRSSLTPGKILISVTVPLETAVGGKPTHTVTPWAGSAAELAATLVPKGVLIVTAFNNVSAEPLSDLKRNIECDVLVCGNDAEAKRTAMELVSAIPGARGIDAGPLENSRTVEQLTALLVSLNIRYGVHNAGIRLTGIPMT